MSGDVDPVVVVYDRLLAAKPDLEKQAAKKAVDVLDQFEIDAKSGLFVCDTWTESQILKANGGMWWYQVLIPNVLSSTASPVDIAESLSNYICPCPGAKGSRLPPSIDAKPINVQVRHAGEQLRLSDLVDDGQVKMHVDVAKMLRISPDLPIIIEELQLTGYTTQGCPHPLRLDLLCGKERLCPPAGAENKVGPVHVHRPGLDGPDPEETALLALEENQSIPTLQECRPMFCFKREDRTAWYNRLIATDFEKVHQRIQKLPDWNSETGPEIVQVHIDAQMTVGGEVKDQIGAFIAWTCLHSYEYLYHYVIDWWSEDTQKRRLPFHKVFSDGQPINVVDYLTATKNPQNLSGIVPVPRDALVRLVTYMYDKWSGQRSLIKAGMGFDVVFALGRNQAYLDRLRQERKHQNLGQILDPTDRAIHERIILGASFQMKVAVFSEPFEVIQPTPAPVAVPVRNSRGNKPRPRLIEQQGGKSVSLFRR